MEKFKHSTLIFKLSVLYFAIMMVVSLVLEHRAKAPQDNELKGSIRCEHIACDTTFLDLITICYATQDTSFEVQTFPQTNIKPNGSITLQKMTCVDCRGTTYYELRDEKDHLLTTVKNHYKGQIQRSEPLSARWLLSTKKIKIYEYDTLLNKRTYVQDLN